MKSYSIRLNDEEYEALCKLRENGINVQSILKKAIMSEEKAFEKKEAFKADKEKLVEKAQEAKERYEKEPDLYSVKRLFDHLNLSERLEAFKSGAITNDFNFCPDAMIDACKTVKANARLRRWNSIVNHILSEEED